MSQRHPRAAAGRTAHCSREGRSLRRTGNGSSKGAAEGRQERRHRRLARGEQGPGPASPAPPPRPQPPECRGWGPQGSSQPLGQVGVTCDTCGPRYSRRGPGPQTLLSACSDAHVAMWCRGAWTAHPRAPAHASSRRSFASSDQETWSGDCDACVPVLASAKQGRQYFATDGGGSITG